MGLFHCIQKIIYKNGERKNYRMQIHAYSNSTASCNILVHRSTLSIDNVWIRQPMFQNKNIFILLYPGTRRLLKKNLNVKGEK